MITELEQARASIRSAIVVSSLVAMALHPGAATAQDKRLSPAFAKCMDAVDYSALKHSQFEACYRAELKVQDQQLNAEYKKQQTKMKGDSRNLLTNAQKSWISFRDGWCKYVGSIDAAPSPEVNQAACLVDLTADQVKRLKESVN